MTSFKFFMLYLVACFLAYSFTYFMPLLQNALWEKNGLFEHSIATSAVQDISDSGAGQLGDIEDTKPVVVDEVNGREYEASAPVELDTGKGKAKAQEKEPGGASTRQPSESGIQKSGSATPSRDEGEAEWSDDSEGLPVYREYSEVSVYMLGMLASEDEEEERASGACVSTLQDHSIFFLSFCVPP